jgi:KaiC/GvpD/RAD55 family RecA-like ATPase
VIIISVRDKFKKGVKSLKDYIVLVTVDAKNYQKSNMEILKLLVDEQKTPGVYVTLNKPFDVMQRLFKQNKIDAKFVIFIDGITKVSEERRRIKNCLFIGSPEKLSDISVAMDQAVKALPTKEKFIFFDSINTLSVFNKPGTVARFVYFLASKIREWKVKGVIISIKKGADESLTNELMQFCDSRVDFGGT